jgi:hypothetical protein
MGKLNCLEGIKEKQKRSYFLLTKLIVEAYLRLGRAGARFA